jgi:dolichyl-phosphate-mannose--protein O-mannosyl transferase
MPRRGFGDRYMQWDFRLLPMPKRILLLIKAMYIFNRDLGSSHPSQSKWWQWPLCLARPMVVRDEDWLGRVRILYIFNNPVVAVLSFVGFFAGMTRWDYQFSFGYFAALAPFTLVTRPTWTYHYEIALIFGVIVLCRAIGRLPKGLRWLVVVAFGTAALVAFAIWFPWLYFLARPADFHRKLMIWKKKTNDGNIVY